MAEKATTSLKKRAVFGSGWILFSTGAAHFLRFISNVVLTRLLVPEYFGLMSVINVFVAGIQMIGDLGIKPGIIQNKNGYDETFLNTAWTIQIVRGVSLWFFLSILAYPLSLFYETPSLIYLIPVVSFSLVIGGFNSTNLITLNKKLEVRWLVICDFTAHCVGLVFMVSWAYLYPSLGALVFGSLAAALVKLMLSHWVCPGIRNKLKWDPEALHQIIHFGKWVMISSVVTLLLREGDRMIMGKFFSWDQLGVYSIALMLARFPEMINSQLGHAVLFPALSEKFNTSQNLAIPLRKYKLVSGTLFLTMLSIGTVYGPLIVDTIYDSRYHAAGWMFSLLCIGQAITILNKSNTLTMFAQGKPKYSVVSQACGAGWLIIGIVLGGHVSSIQGVILAVSTASIPAIGVIWLIARHYHLQLVSMDLSLLALFFTAVCGMFGMSHLLQLMKPNLSMVLEISINMGLLSLIVVTFVFVMMRWWRLKIRDLV